MQETQNQTKIQAMPWHSQILEQLLFVLKVDPNIGLAPEEVLARRQAYGPNVLPKGKKTTALEMILHQFGSPLVYILLVAAALTWWIKEYGDMIVILVVVVGNAIIGFFQEYRANKIFEKLKEIVKVEALIIRGGKLRSALSEELVPGDIIVLKGGNKVPADARLLEESELSANEALLTGESKPVLKKPGMIFQKALVGDRHNMVFMGTVIEEGNGRAVVVATGARTEIGQISLLTQTTPEEESPLQQRMGKLARFLTEIFVVISAAIFLIGLAEGDSVIEMFKTTIAVAVAAIPEGLPAVISIILAVSSKKILERKGLVMKLIAAETLGSTSVICVDKTGTLTYGEMKVEELLTPSSPARPADGSPPYPPRAEGERKGVDEALLTMALANEAVMEEKDGKMLVRGESTDKAKLEKFLASGQVLDDVLAKMPRIGLVPFDSDRKFLASFHKNEKKLEIFVSGAPEVLLAKSNMNSAEKDKIQKTYENYANRGFRLIALGKSSVSMPKNLASEKPKLDELLTLVKNLEYLGLACIRDPIREDVKDALKVTKTAGVKVMMITGDHVLTAKAIGLELGFSIAGAAAITGQELDLLSDQELKSRIGKLEIIARATPVHKMRIIGAWQKLGAVVAMTGDGVNDAPALKAADIGVAIGSGTDVAKEASDLILLDDSFATISAAVQEGRTGFANIRKATVVVMSNAFTEIVLITGALVFRTAFLPVTAIQILWVNIVEDGLPVLSLAFEPTEKGIMRRPPLSPTEPILDRGAKSIIFTVSILADLMLLAFFLYLVKYSGWDMLKIQSTIFVATATPTLLNIFALKSLRESLRKIDLFNNKILNMAVIVGFALMLLAIYVPFFNKFLKTVPLPILPAIFSLLLFPLFKLCSVELTKWWYRNHGESIAKP